MMGHLHRWLAPLHRHGLHAAVLAGLIIMPAVVAAGFLTASEDGAPPPRSKAVVLRGSFDPIGDHPDPRGPALPLRTPPSEPRQAP